MTILKSYKQPDGTVYFPALFEINSQNRLTQLAITNYKETVSVVAAGLTLSFEAMNLVRPMNSAQVMDLSETILESAGEDNLALEDLMLFLQKLVRGEYGPLYEGMDIPKFMQFFDLYREQRFQAMKDIREEQAAQHNAIPVNERLIDIYGIEKDKQREAIKDYLINKP